MCFSATASFTTSALLVPVGIYCAKKALETDKRYVTLAAVPLLFGIQQVFEGGLWLAIGDLVGSRINIMALGFLFFADFLWPLLIPLACAFVEVNIRKRHIFFVFSFLGGLFGLSLYLPLLLQPDWLSVELMQGSILYHLVQIYDAIIPQPGVRIIYVIIIATPLLGSSVYEIRVLGVLLLVSIFVSTLLFSYAFVSVWCFFAAIISCYVFSIVNHIKPVLKR